jgi:hypothetical protein
MQVLRLLVIACALAGAPALAQTFGEITGQVTDPAGATVPGAKVTATNSATNAVREAVSNDAGVYGFPALQPGVYNLRVEKPGFRAVARNGVRLEVQQNARIDFELTVGAVTESIEVSAQAALLASENATVGTVIDSKQIVELPLNGRNYLELVSLAPNVSAGFPAAGQAGSRQGGIRAQQSISVGGQRSNFNHFTLDGVDNTDPNFNTSVVLPSIDALQEFKVQTGVYPAEFGREVTQINVSTKSGTNQYHGTLFHFLRNEKLDATNYAFTSARPARDPFKWNQFGFTVGGPVSLPKLFNGQNKLFFMANYEWFRQRRSIQAFSNIPSEAMRRGDFSARPLGTLGIFDPRSRAVSGGTVTATPFPGNVIPATRFHPTSQKLLEFYPTPNVATTALSRNFQQAQGRPINRDQFVSRFDFVESNNSQWSGRYSWGDENETNEALRLNGSKIITNFNQYMVSNTRILTPAVVNETRFGFTQFYNTIGPELAFSRDVTGSLSIPGLPGGPPVQWGIPNVTFVGVYTGFGNDTEGPYENNNNAIQFINNTSIIRGKHTIKFGGEIRRDAYNQVGNQFARGQFMFSRNASGNPGISGITGDPMADFLLGETFQAEAAVSIANARYRATSFALYLDETWKISRRLTINAGLRYEMTPPWEDQTGRLFNGIVRHDLRATNIQDRSLYPFFMRQGPPSQDPYSGIAIRWPNIEVRQDGTLGNRLVQIDKNDWAPRLGITWAPNDKWVIRTGGGYFYSQDTGNPRFDMARNLAGRLRFNSNTQVPTMNWDNALASVAGGVANVPTPYTFANPYDRRTPYTAQYLFNVQRELPANTVFEAGYLGSVSRHLESLRAVNETLPACPSRNVATRPECANDPLAGISIPLRAPFPTFGRIQLVDNGGVGNYNSLALKLTKRYSNSVTLLVSYTWSKSIDTSTAIRNQGGDTLFPQNSYCRNCERARSSHDVRHAMVTSGLWDIPVGKGRRVNTQNPVLNNVAGGWQLSTTVTLRTGFPVTFQHGQDLSNTGAGFDRPNTNGISADLPRGQQDPQRFFDTSTIRPNLPGTHGNVGRNTLTGPGTIGWDFAMHKDFLFTERQRLQFRFEAFNFPNHPNWGNPNTNATAAAFGTIVGTRGNMRQLQFALKYYF